MIKNFKNKLTTLKEKLKDKNKIEEIRDLYSKKEEKIKKELVELETRKNEELEEFLRYGRVRGKFWERSSINDEIEEIKDQAWEKHEIEELRR